MTNIVLLVLLLAAPAWAATLQVRWLPVDSATSYRLYCDGTVCAELACGGDPCAQLATVATVPAMATLTALNAQGESGPSDAVPVGQASGSTTTTTSRPTTSSTRVSTTTSIAVPATTSTTIPSGSVLLEAYGFEETTGTALVDSSGNGRVGALGTATRTTAGRFGRALSFTGGTQATAPVVSSVVPRTVEAWVNPAALSGWKCPLSNVDGGAYWYLCAFDRTVIAGYTRTGSSPWIEAEGGTLTVGTWTHLAATFAAGGTVSLYVNGALVQATPSTSGGPVVTTASHKIGRGFTSERWTGLIDEVRFYSAVLSSAAIQADMNQPVVGAGSSTTLPPGTTSSTATTSTTSTTSTSKSTTTSSSSTSTTIICCKPSTVPCPP